MSCLKAQWMSGITEMGGVSRSCAAWSVARDRIEVKEGDRVKKVFQTARR